MFNNYDDGLTTKQKCVMVAALVLIMVMMTDIPELTCNSDKDTCQVYTKTVFTPKKLKNEFKISEIQDADAQWHSTRRRSYYRPRIIFKDGRRLVLPFRMGNQTAAKNVVHNIMLIKNYSKKAGFWKSFFRIY